MFPNNFAILFDAYTLCSFQYSSLHMAFVFDNPKSNFEAIFNISQISPLPDSLMIESIKGRIDAISIFGYLSLRVSYHLSVNNFDKSFASFVSVRDI